MELSINAPGSPEQMPDFSASGAKTPRKGPPPWAGQDCALCLAPCGAAGVCDYCERSLLRCGPLGGPVDAIALYRYAFPVDRMIQRFKFASDLALGRWLGERLAERAGFETRPDLLVVPPLSPERLRERGFNQALELAKVVASRLGLPLDPRAMSRIPGSVPQVGLDRAGRLRNLERAFRAHRRFDGLHVAVVDDVLTTGATCETLARVLHASGARRASAWVLSHTPAPGS